MNCITVLTRGYNNIHKYNDLIKRNMHISNHLNDKNTDILIFHEGNITKEHQTYIKEKSDLKLIFIDVSNRAFKKEKNIPFEAAHTFGLGYRHMCSFWFINFFDFVTKYDKMIRIDEDCFVESNIDEIFIKLDSYLFISGLQSHDAPFVTKGLNEFSLQFFKKNNRIYKSKVPYGPYTNFFAISLNKINNTLFENYRKEIDESNMIYKRRWGDLPLWGEVIYYIFGENTLSIDKNIKYYHGSHDSRVNM